MAIDPIASALQALATHLTTALGELVASVRVGWPEHEQDFDLAEGPIVTLFAGEVLEERCAPFELDREDTETGVQVLYKVAEMTFPVQLDLWTAYRAHRDDVALHLIEALENRAPHGSGLWLSHEDYHGRPVSFEVISNQRPQAQDGIERGEWRATWMLRVSSALLAIVTHPRIETLEVETETTGGGRTVADTHLYT
jgi:hypothetical protein